MIISIHTSKSNAVIKSELTANFQQCITSHSTETSGKPTYFLLNNTHDDTMDIMGMIKGYKDISS